MPIGPMEIVIVLVILILIFGAGKLSTVGSAMGRSIRDFRDSTREESTDSPAGDAK